MRLVLASSGPRSCYLLPSRLWSCGLQHLAHGLSRHPMAYYPEGL